VKFRPVPADVPKETYVIAPRWAGNGSNSMRTIVLSIAVILMGLLFTVYGTLLAWRPDLFLWFHDTFIDRSRWGKNAAWRNKLETAEYKFLAATYIAFGLFMIFQMFMRLL
jgi:hypothetical protein